jgi:hypothetical protein
MAAVIVGVAVLRRRSARSPQNQVPKISNRKLQNELDTSIKTYTP